jgi:hypothetical protein
MAKPPKVSREADGESEEDGEHRHEARGLGRAMTGVVAEGRPVGVALAPENGAARDDDPLVLVVKLGPPGRAVADHPGPVGNAHRDLDGLAHLGDPRPDVVVPELDGGEDERKKDAHHEARDPARL